MEIFKEKGTGELGMVTGFFNFKMLTTNFKKFLFNTYLFHFSTMKMKDGNLTLSVHQIKIHQMGSYNQVQTLVKIPSLTKFIFFE